jgi:hypothetical protein
MTEPFVEIQFDFVITALAKHVADEIVQRRRAEAA